MPQPWVATMGARADTNTMRLKWSRRPPTAKLTDYQGLPFEMPSEDVSAGILPVLYQLIRYDYLREAKLAARAWKECRRWFRLSGHESPCCSAEHSLKYRQAQYYRRKGKATRQLRREQRKAVASDAVE
jgi:hypothetical protein